MECLTQQGALELSGRTGGASLERPPNGPVATAKGPGPAGYGSTLTSDLSQTPTEGGAPQAHPLPSARPQPPLCRRQSWLTFMPLLTRSTPWRTELEERKPAE